jgi:hypothetical protein
MQDLLYFVAKADAKVKKLRASLGDYDAGEVEHHKVLKTIFSLTKRLLNLCGEDASKEFIKDYSTL